jgi:hypothetical protein
MESSPIWTYRLSKKRKDPPLLRLATSNNMLPVLEGLRPRVNDRCAKLFNRYVLGIGQEGRSGQMPPVTSQRFRLHKGHTSPSTLSILKLGAEQVD